MGAGVSQEVMRLVLLIKIGSIQVKLKLGCIGENCSIYVLLDTATAHL